MRTPSRPPQRSTSEGIAKLAAARAALNANRVSEARGLVGEARVLGVLDDDANSLAREVREAQIRLDKNARLGPWAGFTLGLLFYLGLSLMQPPAWGVPVWLILAFLVGPVLVGVMTGRMAGPQTARRSRFRGGLWAGVAAMFLYSSLNMMIVHARVGRTGDTWQVFLVGLFVAGVYSAIAGAVSGAASGHLAWLGQRESGS